MLTSELSGLLFCRSGTGTKAEARAVRQGEELTDLVEIGPRFVLCPIRIFAGSFGGPTLYQNPDFVSPNFVRAQVCSHIVEFDFNWKPHKLTVWGLSCTSGQEGGGRSSIAEAEAGCGAQGEEVEAGAAEGPPR